MFVGMNNIEQGDLGESIARCWYELHGHVVFIPTGRSPDYDFVVSVDGRRWRIPSGAVGATTKISLGGRKYAQYEVEPGPALRAPAPRLSLVSPAAAG